MVNKILIPSDYQKYAPLNPKFLFFLKFFHFHNFLIHVLHNSQTFQLPVFKFIYLFYKHTVSHICVFLLVSSELIILAISNVLPFFQHIHIAKAFYSLSCAQYFTGLSLSLSGEHTYGTESMPSIMEIM